MISFVVIAALMSVGLLLADARPAFAYVDPLLPGLLYQIGYFLVYGLIGVFAFFKPIKRMFTRRKETDPPKHDV